MEAPGPGAGGTQAAGGEPVEWVAVVATKPSGQALARQLVPWLDRRGGWVGDLRAAGGPRRAAGPW
ncbi:MAG: ATP-NAD kinase, partial [Bacillota bacterium]